MPKIQHRHLNSVTVSIEYELIRSNRRTMALQVYPGGRVVVRAPSRMPIIEIERLLFSRAAWVMRHQERMKARAAAPPVPPRAYTTGESFQYLGRAITLQVEQSPRERIWLHEDTLAVRVNNPRDSAHIAALVRNWFDGEAKRHFNERLPVCVEHAQAIINIPPPTRLTIRHMKTRWGTCSSKGRITLNTRLIHLSPDLIDYVILHELCHLIEMNHSPAFYALMGKVVTDWKQKRKRLKRIR